MSAVALTTDTISDDVRDLVSEWSQLPYPLEAAVLAEANQPGDTVRRAADLIHRRPPGGADSTRSVWVVARLVADDERVRLRGWCWYATRAAAMAAGTQQSLLHEVSVPRSVRCDGVESYLARYYRCGPCGDDAAASGQIR
ncbi:MAG: hypothetical protein Q4G43_02920 [Mobilicoccus sp.]|nr:hypothetical protein [Mobilicoccus sp.]